MKLTSFPLAMIIFVLLFGGIGFTSAMNWWQTESTKVPATYTEGEAAGQYNPADIRGSYTFGDVSQLFDIPLADLQAAFRLPLDADPASYPLKSLEAQFEGLPVEMGTGSVRMFVAFYKGLPYDLTAAEDTYLFPEAAEALKARGQMTVEQLAYLEDHIALAGSLSEPADLTPLEATPVLTQATGAEPTPAPTEHVAPDRTVTGKTTFQDLLDWGMTQDQVEQILGEPMPAPQTVLKEFVTGKGLEFSALKTRFQDTLNK
jgi:hypothetical protein